MIFGALMLMAAAGQSLPSIKIDPVPGKGYSATVGDYKVSQEDAVIDAVKARVDQTCGKLKARWGRYAYNTLPSADGNANNATRQNYRQTFSCYDPAHDPYKAAPANWKATEKDKADATAFLKRYLVSYDTADAKTGVPMMESLLEMDAPTWLAGRVTKTSTAVTRTIRGPAWMVNPDGAAHPGVYVAFGFDG